MGSEEPRTKNEIEFANEASSDQEAYETLARKIEDRKHGIGRATFEIGFALIEAKKRLSHGQFIRFLRDERVGFEPRTAQLLMNIARAEDGPELALYGVAKASLLLRLKPEIRRQMMSAHDVKAASVARLRELVNRALGFTGARRDAQFGAGRRDKFQRGFEEGMKRGLGVQAKVAWAAGVLHVPLDKLSVPVVESAFKELAKILHPDLGLAKDEKFIRDLYEARATLIAHIPKAKAA